MPPPKKPKEGLTRVDEYLSDREIQVLKSKRSLSDGDTDGRSSTSSSGQSQQQDVPNLDNSLENDTSVQMLESYNLSEVCVQDSAQEQGEPLNLSCTPPSSGERGLKIVSCVSTSIDTFPSKPLIIANTADLEDLKILRVEKPTLVMRRQYKLRECQYGNYNARVENGNPRELLNGFKKYRAPMLIRAERSGLAFSDIPPNGVNNCLVAKTPSAHSEQSLCQPTWSPHSMTDRTTYAPRLVQTSNAPSLSRIVINHGFQYQTPTRPQELNYIYQQHKDHLMSMTRQHHYHETLLEDDPDEVAKPPPLIPLNSKEFVEQGRLLRNDFTSPSNGQDIFPMTSSAQAVYYNNISEPMSYRQLDKSAPKKTTASTVACSNGSAVIESPSSTTEAPRSAPVVQEGGKGQQCLICNDSASGYHYGVWSCEGCKAFFKRSLQGTIEYICPATNNCNIDKHRRKCCQACRLRKCLDKGMSTASCRVRTKKSQIDTTGLEPEVKQMRLPAAVDIARLIASMDNNQAVSEKNDMPHNGAGETGPGMHLVVEHLLQLDPPARLSGHDNSQPDTEARLMTTLLRHVQQELVNTLNWAKVLPGFVELPGDTQTSLLNQFWVVVFLQGVLWRTATSGSDTSVKFAQDLQFNLTRFNMTGMGRIGVHLLKAVQLWKERNIGIEEFVVLRALLLLKAGIYDPQYEAIYQLRQMLLHVLSYTMCLRNQKTPLDIMQVVLDLDATYQLGHDFLNLLREKSMALNIPFMYTAKTSLNTQN